MALGRRHGLERWGETREKHARKFQLEAGEEAKVGSFDDWAFFLESWFFENNG